MNLKKSNNFKGGQNYGLLFSFSLHFIYSTLYAFHTFIFLSFLFYISTNILLPLLTFTPAFGV